MNDEWERLWKVAVMTTLRNYSYICQKEPKKMTEKHVRIIGLRAEI
jgi:hypothetical protein